MDKVSSSENAASLRVTLNLLEKKMAAYRRDLIDEVESKVEQKYGSVRSFLVEELAVLESKDESRSVPHGGFRAPEQAMKRAATQKVSAIKPRQPLSLALLKHVNELPEQFTRQELETFMTERKLEWSRKKLEGTLSEFLKCGVTEWAAPPKGPKPGTYRLVVRA